MTNTEIERAAGQILTAAIDCAQGADGNEQDLDAEAVAILVCALEMATEQLSPRRRAGLFWSEE